MTYVLEGQTQSNLSLCWFPPMVWPGLSATCRRLSHHWELSIDHSRDGPGFLPALPDTLEPPGELSC
jgi:hypothetical protein